MTKKQKTQKLITELNKLFPNPKTQLNYSNPWQLFVAVVLSARNTDKKVNEVTKTLFTKYKKIDDYRNTSLEEFTKDIAQVGLFRQKAKSIKESAELLAKKHKDKIPETMEELVQLPGVGRKTANVLLAEIYNKKEGVVVDTHVARLSQLFGLTSNTSPEKIEKDLMKLLPKEKWRDFPLQLILYGRTYHKARSKKDHPLMHLVVK